MAPCRSFVLSAVLSSCVSGTNVRSLATCGKLGTCYLVNLNDGTEQAIESSSSSYKIFDGASYTVRCTVVDGAVDSFAFAYESGETQTERVVPYTMGGDFNGMMFEVGFLVQRCGTVKFSVMGEENDGTECFAADYSLFAECADGFLPPNTCDATTFQCGFVNGEPSYELNRVSGFGPCETICRAGQQLGDLIDSGGAECGDCPLLCGPEIGNCGLEDGRQTYPVKIEFSADGYCFERCFPNSQLFSVLRDGSNQCGSSDEAEACSDRDPCNFNTGGMHFYRTHSIDSSDGSCTQVCTRGNAIDLATGDICGPCP